MDIEELDRLGEVAAAIMTHLELVTAQERLYRSQEMMRGLGRYIDGKSVRE
jgi:hypothetical protein